MAEGILFGGGDPRITRRNQNLLTRVAGTVRSVDALAEIAPGGAVLLVAADLPRLTLATLMRLAAWPGEGTVIPTVRGQLHPLCARWGAGDLARAVTDGLDALTGLTRVEWGEPDALDGAHADRFTRLSHPGPPGA